ncbi:MAG: pyrroline-5-carboxylate reductase [Deltaproteobacteria bacterium]|nr:pyrroline-5-carboxylate reductase [Deltaproteobacteria bacterium]
MGKTAIIGVGGLGGALADGLLAQGAQLSLCDRHPEKLARFVGRAETHLEPAAAVVDAEIVVLAVKPKVTPATCALVASAAPGGALLVSCAAGVPVQALPWGGPVARAMPNIGAARGASTTALFLGPRCDRARDLERLAALFGAVGSVREVPDEAWLHIVTAVAASGPAFLLLAVEALIDAAVEAGMPRADAMAYAGGALRAAAVRLEDQREPAALRAEVTSPGGTTAAGLASLEAGGVRAAYHDAVRAAVARARELAHG